MLTFLTAAAVAFSLFALSRVFLRMRKSEISKGEFAFWSLLWIVIIIISVIPRTTNFLAQIVGIGRGADLALVIAVILLFYLNFRLYVKISNTEQEITRLVRELALGRKK